MGISVEALVIGFDTGTSVTGTCTFAVVLISGMLGFPK